MASWITSLSAKLGEDIRISVGCEVTPQCFSSVVTASSQHRQILYLSGKIKDRLRLC
jgi:hypothetical protein